MEPGFALLLWGVVCTLACLCADVAQAAERTITLESLLDEMTDRDRTAMWPLPAYVSGQASSYDRRSKTPDDPEGWFANDDWSHFVRSEVNQGRREWVLLDVDGPGCVTRIWWGGMMPPPERRLRAVQVDAETSAIESPAYELLTGPALVGTPLAMENGQGPPGAPGGMNLFLPIPYAHHCKITWDDVNPHDPASPPESRWYNIEYRTYPPVTPVETFTLPALTRARSTVARIGKMLLNPPAPVGGKRVTLKQEITPGGEASVALPDGPAAVRRLEMRLTTPEAELLAQALRSTVLRMECDGEETVWCPVGDFFGSGAGINPLQSWYRTVTPEGLLTCRWVMPYQKNARLTLQNLGPTPVQVYLEALTGEWEWNARSLTFHANWRYQNPLPTRPFSDWNYLTVTGQGVYLGDTLCVCNPVREWWGEGDEKIWVDGDTFPSHFGTGTEDYYGYSWGNTTLFQGPFCNQVRCDGPDNQGNTVVTRTRCLDAIPFARSLKFDMEVWHWADCKLIYAVTTYWYARPGAVHNCPPQPDAAATIP